MPGQCIQTIPYYNSGYQLSNHLSDIAPAIHYDAALDQALLSAPSEQGRRFGNMQVYQGEEGKGGMEAGFPHSVTFSGTHT